MKEGIPTHREFTSCDERMKPAWMQPPHTSLAVHALRPRLVQNVEVAMPHAG